jgi:hypothetical protein
VLLELNSRQLGFNIYPSLEPRRRSTDPAIMSANSIGLSNGPAKKASLRLIAGKNRSCCGEGKNVTLRVGSVPKAEKAGSARCLTNKRRGDFHASAKMPIVRLAPLCQFRDNSI